MASHCDPISAKGGRVAHNNDTERFLGEAEFSTPPFRDVIVLAYAAEETREPVSVLHSQQ